MTVIVPAVADLVDGGAMGVKVWECVVPDGSITGLGDDFFEARADLARKIKESGVLPPEVTHIRILVTTRKTFAVDDL